MNTELFIHKLEWIPDAAGVVWLLLTILLLITLKIVRQQEDKKAKLHSKLLFVLIACCWCYPTFLLGFALMPAFIGSAVTVVFAACVVWHLSKHSKVAASLASTVMVWGTLATFYIGLLLFSAV